LLEKGSTKFGKLEMRQTTVAIGHAYVVPGNATETSVHIVCTYTNFLTTEKST
jgi:hypothetical protein